MTFVVIWSYKPNTLKLWSGGGARWKSQKFTKVITIHPEDNLNVCAKFNFENGVMITQSVLHH